MADATADSNAEKPRGRPFAPGNNANPAGRPKGSRNAIGEDFLKALHDDFNALGEDGNANGVTAIADCRREDPVQYVKVVAALLPKQIEISPLETLTDDQLIERLVQLRAAYAASLGGTGAAGDGTQQTIEHAQAPTLPALH